MEDDDKMSAFMVRVHIKFKFLMLVSMTLNNN
jgi:hypothetical protein